ncbi:predicted protein [Nematostella vectensis]|uniref:NAD-dependent epimerase/dehydratase domain-containing protein n=1 Tax=Nematostella vectensis TaxID=45351 RepID=A7RRD1_NEMVE|nr:predicted protein [Nematostella vectensis]|eukprot:XP_001637988.1 predicted protein [Nematostella vectensis]
MASITCRTVLLLATVSYIHAEYRTVKKFLVLGGNGLMGSELVSLLNIQPATDITIVNRGNWYWDSYHRIKPFVTHVKCDRFIIHDCTQLKKVAESKFFFDVVFDFSSYQAKQLRDFLDLMRHRIGRYVYISSDSVYEVSQLPPNFNGEPSREEDAVRPASRTRQEELRLVDGYGHNKLECEEVLEDEHALTKLPYISLRIPDVIDPYSHLVSSYPRPIFSPCLTLSQTHILTLSHLIPDPYSHLVSPYPRPIFSPCLTLSQTHILTLSRLSQTHILTLSHLIPDPYSHLVSPYPRPIFSPCLTLSQTHILTLSHLIPDPYSHLVSPYPRPIFSPCLTLSQTHILTLSHLIPDPYSHLVSPYPRPIFSPCLILSQTHILTLSRLSQTHILTLSHPIPDPYSHLVSPYPRPIFSPCLTLSQTHILTLSHLIPDRYSHLVSPYPRPIFSPCLTLSQTHILTLSHLIPDPYSHLILGPRDNTDRFWFYFIWVKFQDVLKRPVNYPPYLQGRKLSFVFSEDVAILMNHLPYLPDNVFNQAYNLACKEMVTLEEFIKLLGEHVGVPDVQFDKVEERGATYFPSVQRGPLNITKAEKMLPWKPTALSRVIKKTAEFYSYAMFATEFKMQRDGTIKAFVPDEVMDKFHKKYQQIYGQELKIKRFPDEL